MGQPTTRIPERNPNAGQRELNTGAMSIDQVVARHIGAGDRFNSLPLGVLTDPMGATIWTRMSYGALGQFIHPDSDPRSVYQRLFGGITRDANSLERLQRRRRSVLDLVLGDLNSIRRRVGREERRKLDMHLEGIRDMERGLFQKVSSVAKRRMHPHNSIRTITHRFHRLRALRSIWRLLPWRVG